MAFIDRWFDDAAFGEDRAAKIDKPGNVFGYGCIVFQCSKRMLCPFFDRAKSFADESNIKVGVGDEVVAIIGGRHGVAAEVFHAEEKVLEGKDFFGQTGADVIEIAGNRTNKYL